MTRRLAREGAAIRFLQYGCPGDFFFFFCESITSRIAEFMEPATNIASSRIVLSGNQPRPLLHTKHAVAAQVGAEAETIAERSFDLSEVFTSKCNLKQLFGPAGGRTLATG